MATARIVAHQGGKPKPPSTLFTLEEVVPVQYHNQEDSTTLPSFHVDQGNVAVRLGLGRKKTDDGELDIFSAEKYFSGDIVLDSIESRHLAPAKKETETPRSTKSGSPGVCSELSRNSRSSLLRPSLKEPIPSPRRTTRNRRIVDVLRCICSCSGDKSIDVESDGSNQSKHGEDVSCGGDQREEHFSLPPLNLGKNSTVGREFKEEKVARIYFGGFDSPILEKRVLRGLTMLASSQNGGGGNDDDDNPSESNSELFEIESISTNRYPHFLPGSSMLSGTTTTGR